ncbi:hypothetical protein GCM10027290_23130 [Micromonospora sonneratiae]
MSKGKGRETEANDDAHGVALVGTRTPPCTMGGTGRTATVPVVACRSPTNGRG